MLPLIEQPALDFLNLEVWYTTVDMDEFRTRFDSMLKETQRKKLDKGLAKARTRTACRSWAS